MTVHREEPWRYTIEYDGGTRLDKDGKIVFYRDHLIAIQRARIEEQIAVREEKVAMLEEMSLSYPTKPGQRARPSIRLSTRIATEQAKIAALRKELQ